MEHSNEDVNKWAGKAIFYSTCNTSTVGYSKQRHNFGPAKSMSLYLVFFLPVFRVRCEAIYTGFIL